jgi:hypothetical protein
MLIKIVSLLILFIFIVYLSKKREGLMNQFNPISIRRRDDEYIFKRMTTPGDVLYDGGKYIRMNEADVISDMSYFNNATSILYMLSKFDNNVS